MSSGLAVVVAVAAFGQSAILGAGLAEAVSYVPNWRHPEALAAYRGFVRARHPGHFYGLAAPITLLVLLAALVWSWADGQVGLVWLIATAATSIVATVALTGIYFLSRNNMLVFAPLETPPGERSRAIVRQWERVNVIRLLIQVPGIAAIMVALIAV
jgi:hypothetical protein